jgi:hypothetical protein
MVPASRLLMSVASHLSNLTQVRPGSFAF